MISKDDRAQIVSVTRKLLEDRFREDFVFDPIAAVPKIDEYGDEYVEIYIVFDGNQKKLDPAWTHRLIGLIIDELDAGGVELLHIPGTSFVKNSDWKRLYRKLYGEYESLRPD